jgi:UDP-N-acetylmuramyl pentapeptide phosphotransferase/UDP-N-acetylglucosamine-1-phosphate transferase
MTGFAALLVVLFAVPAFVAAWAWRGLALRRGWLDLPEARRLHREPTPRGGGVAILLALVMAMSSLLDLHGTYGAILAGLLITAGAGLLDDLRPLSAPVKLLLQVAGTLPLAWATAAPTGPDGSVLGFAAAWGLSLALVNAWNFIDGSNGLAGSQGLLVGVAAMALAIVVPAPEAGQPRFGDTPLLVLGAALAGGCLGFLPMNFPRARVFLGDVGSHAIGYVVAALGLLALRQERIPGLLLWLPVSAVVLDTGLTLADRLRRGEKVWLGHREHLYQRAIAAGRSHGAVASAYAAWTLAATGLAAALAGQPPGAVTTAVFAVYAGGILIYVSAGRRWPLPALNTEREG